MNLFISKLTQMSPHASLLSPIWDVITRSLPRLPCQVIPIYSPEADLYQHPVSVVRAMTLSSELESLRHLLSFSPGLTEVQIRRGATDELMKMIGECCPLLQEINMYVFTSLPPAPPI